MRVTFRWPRGALATNSPRRRRLGGARARRHGARARRGHRPRPRRAGAERAQHRRRRRAGPLRPLAATVGWQRCRRWCAATASGSGSFRQSNDGDLDVIAARARGAGHERRLRREVRTPESMIRSSRRSSSRTSTPAGCASAPGSRLRLGPARRGRRRGREHRRRRGLPHHRRRDGYEGRCAAAQRYVQALRAAIDRPIRWGYVVSLLDYHPSFPYSVFLSPGRAQANLPQIFWKDMGPRSTR